MPKTIPVSHIAKLANIPITQAEEKSLEKAFDETLKVVDELKNVDVSTVQPTYQVTGSENILREDEVDEARMFTQAQALANAKKVHDGYFIVNQVIDAE